MKYKGRYYYSIWLKKPYIKIINQALLPYKFQIKTIKTINSAIDSIKKLEIRGAPALGIMGAFSVALSYFLNKKDIKKVKKDYLRIINSRPTAINLKIGANFIFSYICDNNPDFDETFDKALFFQSKEIDACKNIGEKGYKIIEEIFRAKQDTVNILVHCNAGWLACGDFGTALAPVYIANTKNIPLHIWVDETRPLNQGSRLTAWELYNEGIKFSIIPDNTAGLLMMKKQIDIVIIGADRIVKNGDVINKIGSYMLALAAKDNNIPFYIAAPLSTFDFNTPNGNEVIIEIRKSDEVKKITSYIKGKKVTVSLFPPIYPAYNSAFDITPSKMISGYITEKGIYYNVDEIIKLYGNKG